MFSVNATLIVFLFSFLIFVYLLDVVLWRPIRKIKAQRDSDISDRLGRAVSLEEENKKISEEIDREMMALRDEHSDKMTKVQARLRDISEQETEKLKKALAVKKQHDEALLAQTSSDIKRELSKYSHEISIHLTEKILSTK